MDYSVSELDSCNANLSKFVQSTNIWQCLLRAQPPLLYGGAAEVINRSGVGDAGRVGPSSESGSGSYTPR